MQRQIISLLSQDSYQPSNVPKLLELLSLPPSSQQALQSVLRLLVKKGKIQRLKGNKYQLASAEGTQTSWIGPIQINRAGKGFLSINHPTHSEIVINEKFINGALSGDTVEVRLRTESDIEKETGEKINGEVIKIIHRRTKSFVGAFHRVKKNCFVTPDNPRIPAISVKPPKDVGRPCLEGDKVVVEITDWGTNPTSTLKGEVIEVLGSPDAEGVDMLSVIRGYGLPLHFPKKVLREAETIASKGLENVDELIAQGKRKDCREDLVITIDPDDAKDFDDAICLRKINSNLWKLWVHIADVSHYVQPNSALDKEAYHRGNSTYLVDRVIPMLPEALSNDLCSLKPGVDRFTKCVEFSLNSQGKILKTKFYSAVIHSQRRFTYQQALEVLQRQPKGKIEQMLHDAHGFAQLFRKKRFANGSLDLDFPENKIRLDEQGRIVRIDRMENDISHQLIEEFMLLANEAVATELLKRNKPGIYRIHESPKKQRLADFSDLMRSHHIKTGDLTLRDNLQRTLDRLKTLPAGPALKIAFLRSLTRARYGAESLGHYGLAKENYTHFTSPIRRYSDLVVHRLIFDSASLPFGLLNEIGQHLSTTEKNSAEAERDSRDVKLFAFLQNQIEENQRLIYTAVVTELKSFGFSIDVTELGMSALVPLSSIKDAYYQLSPQHNALVTRDPSRSIRVGDIVKVRVLKIDRESKLVDFQWVRDTEEPRSFDRRKSSQKERRFKSSHPKSRKYSDGETQRSKNNESSSKIGIPKKRFLKSKY